MHAGWKRKIATLAVASSCLWFAGACDREASQTAPAAGNRAPRPEPEAASSAGGTSEPAKHDLIAHLPGCLISHRGASLDFGTRAAHSRRGFAIGPFEDTDDAEREGATVTRVLARRLDYEIWLDEPVKYARLTVRARGGAARGLLALLDGARLGSVKLARDETRLLTLPGRDGDLAAGRHTLSLRFFGGTRGTEQAYAELDWLRLAFDSAEQEADNTYAAPTFRDVVTNIALDGKPRRSFALRAPSRLRCPIQPSPDARVRAWVGYWGEGQGTAELALVRDGEPPIKLASRRVTGGGGAVWAELSADLAPFARQLVGLELRASDSERGGRVLFGDPAVVRAQPGDERIPEAQIAIVVIGSSLDRHQVPPWGPVAGQVALGDLARRAAAFSAYRVPTTVPAGVVASMVTGMSPRSHAVEDQAARLSESIRTLAAVVKEASGRAAMFTGVPVTSETFGFGSGWDRFEALSPVEDIGAIEPYLRAARWLSQELETDEPRRRLLVIHARGVHPPWDLSREEVSRLEPPEYGGVLDARRGGVTIGKIRVHHRPQQRRLDPPDWVRLRALEQAAMVKQSAALRKLFDLLEHTGRWDDALVVLVGDVAGGAPPELPYNPAGPLEESRLLVPLLVKFPGNRFPAKELTVPVTTADIAATVLDALRLKRPPQVVGLDLFAMAAGQEPIIGRPLLATLGDRFSVRLASWLLHGRFGRRPSLCRLDVDPACVNDVFDAQPLAAHALWQWTYDAEVRARARRAEREPASIDPRAAAALTVWGDIQ